MALAEKVFEAKLYSFKGQIDGLIGMAKRGRLKQSEIVDELALMLMEIGKAIEATETPNP